ncbi:threonine/homoserine/homoserine lactone efflux protein [Hoeflea marina]|uniref:Threonine/homoserine/homoserine lactone efflux protein n=2 Tax=Hoeflea marina TaxID=274592 RepID=A0A317PCF3_9HYPH|nr:threonine/homoserine/homoserine lactone efflux protein [Hoeflea marina]
MTIANASMQNGRPFGLATASGILTGSVLWSCGAAFGLAAIMAASPWTFELMRYVGASYLLYLAFKAARSVFAEVAAGRDVRGRRSLKAAYLQGIAIHLTNPKVILSFGSVYSVFTPPGTDVGTLLLAVLFLGLQSATVFFAYAILFSIKGVVGFYKRMYRWFEGAFGLVYAAAGLALFLHAF